MTRDQHGHVTAPAAKGIATLKADFDVALRDMDVSGPCPLHDPTASVILLAQEANWPRRK